ncbi:hypothetical protein M8C13_18035 [Crossiella sp. SN42]|uniref:hypothetical protein n=1 Tax=Crossiella sp. SN42 TaxID=2944808 RepID=UPI00207C5ABF|nr:hypothetical protein [Crossiella sp. SN42]MCO1577659.1 hypothetical protein [Crossiella sp. SN42]
MRPLLVLPLSLRALGWLALALLVLIASVAGMYFAFGPTTAVVMGLLVSFVLYAVAKAVRC